MTSKPDDAASSSGEARLQSRRTAFVRYVVLSIALAFVVGAVSGVSAFFVEEGAFPAWLFIAAWLAAVVAMIWFTRDYFRRIDELDLIDNLWASTIGLYVFVIAYSSWFVFDLAGLGSEPDSKTLFVIVLIATGIAYGLRKLGWR